MKRTILFALMIPLLLTGCGARRDAGNWKAFAETVETAERISFHAEITAHWEDSSASFGADVARAGGETHITLTAPETVSGITVRAKDGETAVAFDGVILSLDAGRSETLSPCGAPQRMLAALTQGTMEYCASSSAAFRKSRTSSARSSTSASSSSVSFLCSGCGWDRAKSLRS